MKTIAAALLLLLWTAPARALELSLEENRAERGSVGFVDMQKLFDASPDVARAKEGFEELVRQAEERVNLEKAGLVRLHQELASLRAQRDLLAKTLVSTEAATTPVLGLPGMSTTTSPSAPPASSTAAVETSTGPTLGQQLLDFDGRILVVQADILRKESALARERDETDRGLLDVENRKTDQVLARLYRAIREVARKEGASIVVDKSAILFGHPRVDLTESVLKELKGTPQP